uniref:C2H2-type domain-containing protein n=1 Tax=Meloidogyne hapla TaxID=6305 RepID=A0A1I8BCD5_MELHA
MSASSSGCCSSSLNGSSQFNLNIKNEEKNKIEENEEEEEYLEEEDLLKNNFNKFNSKQPIEKRHKCDQCGKRFPYFSILEAHKRIVKSEIDLKLYGTKTVHEKSAHLGLRNYLCPYCDKNLSSPSALYTHKKTHGEKAFKCPGCPKTFTLKNYLKLHIRQVHEQTERKHSCKYCDKSFAYAGSLQVHLRTHTGERPFRCKFCPKAFASQGNLQSHERTHTGERPYLCIECGRSFIQKSQLTAHESTHVSRRSSSSGSSSVRKQQSSDEWNSEQNDNKNNEWTEEKTVEPVVLHLLQPLRVKPEESSSNFQPNELSTSSLDNNFSSSSSTSSTFCSSNNIIKSSPPIINNNFSEIAHCASAPPQPNLISTKTNNNIINSVRKQSFGGNGDFVCKFCGKHYAYASSLYVHTRLHTGERPFRCNYCDKAFTNQGNMQVHLRVHTGERPFKCDGCGKSYAQNIGLKIHQEQCQPWLNCHSNGINGNHQEQHKNNNYNTSTSTTYLNGKPEQLAINNANSDYCNLNYPIYSQSLQQQTSFIQAHQNGETINHQQQINAAAAILLEQQQQQQQMQAIRALLDLSSSSSHHHHQQLNNNILIQQSPPPPTTIPFQNNQEILLNSATLIQNQTFSLHQQLIQQLLAAPVPIEQSLPLVQQLLQQFGPLEEAKLSEAIAAVLVGPSSSTTSSQFCNS